MAASSVAGFIDALVAALILRSGLAGVNVYGCNVDPESLGKEAIELAASVDVEQEPAAMSSDKIMEKYNVVGSILVYQPMVPGASKVATINTAAAAARTRALAIYEEVIDQLASDEDMASTVLWASPGGFTLEQGFAPEGQLGRSCRIEFTIACDAQVTP